MARKLPTTLILKLTDLQLKIEKRWHFLGPDCATTVASLVHISGQARNVVNQAQIDAGKSIPVRFGGHAKLRERRLSRHPPNVEFTFDLRGHLKIRTSRTSSGLLSGWWLIHVVAAAVVFCAVSTENRQHLGISRDCSRRTIGGRFRHIGYVFSCKSYNLFVILYGFCAVVLHRDQPFHGLEAILENDGSNTTTSQIWIQALVKRCGSQRALGDVGQVPDKLIKVNFTQDMTDRPIARCRKTAPSCTLWLTVRNGVEVQ